MTNSRAGKGYQLLHYHKASGTEATYTYTPAAALDMANTYRELKIIITGKATAAFGLELKLNALTNYNTSIFWQDTTTLAGAVATSDSVVSLLLNTLIDGAVEFNYEGTVLANAATGTLSIQGTGYTPHEGIMLRTGVATVGATTVTALIFTTTTSTWISGTEISIYGLRR